MIRGLTVRQFGALALGRAASLFGAEVVSARAHRDLVAQRARAVGELIEQEVEGLDVGISGIVFSRDRALQLHTLLDSYRSKATNPPPLTVLYSASSPEHATAYAELRNEWNRAPFDLEFQEEVTGFRDTLLELLAMCVTRSLFFLVDDIVFVQPVNFRPLEAIDPRAAIVSLRHGPHLRRSYTGRMNQRPPKLNTYSENRDLLEFEWFEQGNEWSNPWSVDGHILSTAELRVLSRVAEYKAPNSYEGALKGFDDLKRGSRGLCFHRSRILNLPLNRVQDEAANISGSISPDFLLAQWSDGMMLDTSPLDDHLPRAPHEEHELRFKPRAKVTR